MVRTFLSHPLVQIEISRRWGLSAPQRCNAERSDAQRNLFRSQFIPLFLQRHRCDALPCFSASPVIVFYIAHIAFPPLLPIFLSPQWFTIQNKKKFTKSHNAAMSPLATRMAIANANANAAMRCTKAGDAHIIQNSWCCIASASWCTSQKPVSLVAPCG